jgi:hypothetical protein
MRFLSKESLTSCDQEARRAIKREREMYEDYTSKDDMIEQTVEHVLTGFSHFKLKR